MADNESDLISQIKIEGVNYSLSELQRYADKGSEAFEQISEAAEDAADQVEKSTQDIERNFKGIGDAAPDAKASSRFQALTASIVSFKAQAADAVGGALRLTTTVAAVGASAVGAVAGFARFASSLTAAARTQHDFYKEGATLAKQQAMQTVQVETAAANYAKQLSAVRRQLANGKIDYTEYSSQVRELSAAYDDQQAALSRVMTAQQEAKRQADQVEEIESRNRAWRELADTYGGPLTGALIQLGNTYDSVYRSVISVLSPLLAAPVARVTQTIESNRDTITNFLSTVATRVGAFVDSVGPSFEQLSDFAGSTIKATGTFITSVVVPAFRALLAVADLVAKAINGIFGTEINGVFLILLALVIKLTAGFASLFSAIGAAVGLIRIIALAFGPWGLAITAVTIAVLALLNLDWSKLAASVAKMIADASRSFSNFTTSVGALLSGLWASITQGATGALDWIKAGWNELSTFFATLTPLLTAGLVLAWEQIKLAASNAASYVQTAWQNVVNFVSSIGTTIADGLQATWDGIVAAVTATVQTITDLFNEWVDFFGELPSMIGGIFSQVGDAIRSAFQSAIDWVADAISSLATRALSYLQPVIDAIKAINSAASGGGEGGSAPGFKSGGSPWARSNAALKGPGTSTSDSIAAWLSRNEFVMQARAVAKYGVGFMQAINSGTFDPSRMAARAAHFAVGGLVGSMGASPRVGLVGAPTGGSRGSQHVLNLTIGDETFRGLSAPEDVAESLTRYAITAQARSAGKKPGWRGV